MSSTFSVLRNWNAPKQLAAEGNRSAHIVT